MIRELCQDDPSWLDDASFIEMSAEQSGNDAFLDFFSVSLPFRTEHALNVNFESMRKFGCVLKRLLVSLRLLINLADRMIRGRERKDTS